jgi:hypothetical protein
LRRLFSSFASLGKPGFASFLAALVLLVGVSAVSPDLHKLLHPNANAPDHSCVVTTLTKGQVNAGPAALIIVTFVAALLGVALRSETFALPSADYRYSSSRAPPSRSLPIR